MKTLLLCAAAAAVALSNTNGCASASGTIKDPTAHANPPAAAPHKTLRAFRSDQELKDFFRRITDEQKREQKRRRAEAQMATGQTSNSAPAPASVAMADASSLSGAKSEDDESVTNAQHAGVDEGGIVKLHGNHLVVLRRGRLFTVEIGGGSLEPVSTLDAFGPDVDPGGAWYDEMIISGDTIAVIGYSYGRGGTEIGLFDIDKAGRLSYRDTYHLRSNDYYSSRNYASRLVGSKLIFYTPLYVSPYGDADPQKSFPSMRKWRRGATENEFHQIVSATRVYRPEREPSAASGLALHTVTVCDLARSELACEATVVVGPPGRVFYVSPSSVYVWTNEWARAADRMRPRSTLYRLPLDGSAPSALGVSGSPVDQFSFLESDNRHLNVLVRSATVGDGMWGAEVAAGDVALLRVPIDSITDGSENAPASGYRQLPKPQGYTFQNRYVGDYLLYGTGNGWGRPEQGRGSTLYAVRWAGGAAAAQFGLPHGVDRIESMGRDAVVVGTDGRDLHFTGVRLGERPALAGRYARAGASQGELRSHGFFYKPDGTDSGLLGLPIQRPGRPGYKHLFETSAAILFLRNDSLDLKELGELGAKPEGSVNDSCRASCVDWYGNARPLFVRGRVFALLGYEIVEGALDGGRMRETRRVNYAPGRLVTATR